MRLETFVGIDAGGTSTLVQAVTAGRVTFVGTSGPGNATSTPETLLARHLAEATAGCPAPVRVGGCFAGLANPEAHQRVSRALSACFPDAELRLAPDYVAAALASPRADVTVIAGTGSACVSLVDGLIESTGGLGYLLGDRGSGFRYGQSLVEHCLLLPEAELPDEARTMLLELFGTTNRSEVVRRVHTDPCPAPLLARFAPALAASALDGVPWAVAIVERETRLLAQLLAGHVDGHLVSDRVDVALAGSVWASAAVRSAFGAHVATLLPARTVLVHRATEAPVAGATRLAAMPDADFGRLVAQKCASVGASYGD